LSQIQELQPLFDEYPYKMKKARMDKGLTQKQLSDMFGVPYSAITKMATNNQDALLNCVALCTVLDVSMDELFGLKASDSKAELHEQNHELEISNIRQEGNIKRLEELNAMLTAQAVRYRTIIFMLLGVCALLLVSVIGYVIFDIQLTTAGLFQSAKTSTLAGFLGLVVLAAIGSIGYAVKTIHKGMKK